MIQYKADIANLIEEELNALPSSIDNSSKLLVKNFCNKKNLISLREIDEDLRKEFCFEVANMPAFNERQKSFYNGAIDRCICEFNREKFSDLIAEINELPLYDSKDKKKKLEYYLILHGIHSAEEITYDDRAGFEAYIRTERTTKFAEYIKAFDLFKLECIKKKKNLIEVPKLKYTEEKVFLLYHPDYDMAMTFYWVQDKTDLVFDFGITASTKLKTQVIGMLNNILENKKDWKERRLRYLLPLKRLFYVLAERGVEDANLITAEDIEAYRNSLKGEVGTQEDIYMQIVDNFREFAFCAEKSIPWDANAWFLSRFNLPPVRLNKANNIRAIYFDDIINETNKAAEKKYMRSLLGNKGIAVITIRTKHYDLKDFWNYLDTKNLEISEITKEIIGDYLEKLLDTDILDWQKNRVVDAVRGIIEYCTSKKIITNPRVDFGRYKTKTTPNHNYLALSESQVISELNASKDLDVKERVMFVLLRTSGNRINEVCNAKLSQLKQYNDIRMLLKDQSKMRKETYIPINSLVFDTILEYAKRENIGVNDYLFPALRGGPYRAGAFSKKVNECFRKHGLKFRSHASRHTIATWFDASGVELQAIREYLGHNSINMTEQYIDITGRRRQEILSDYQNKRGTLIK